MPEALFYLKALPLNEALLRFAAALAEEYDQDHLEDIRIRSNLHDDLVRVPGGPAAGAPQRTTSVREQLNQVGSFLIIRSLEVVVLRGGQERRPSVRYESEDDLTAFIKLTIRDDQAFKEQVIHFAQTFSRHFDFQRRADVYHSVLPDVEKQKLRYQEESLIDFKTALARLGELATKQIADQGEYFTKRLGEIDAETQKQRSQLRTEHDESVAKVEQLRTEGLAQVDRDRQALAKERADFDTMRATAARRKLLTDMKTVISKEIAVSKKTSRRRWIIHIASVIAILGGAAIATFGIHGLLAKEVFDWRYMSVTWTGIALAASTLIFYLRWNNHWFATLARQEFDTRKLDVDVLRASWVAEMLLEWNDEKDKPFPAQLLTSFTEGLFRPSDWIGGDHHPLIDASKALADVTKVKVGNTGIEVNRKVE